jgi:sugar lactone lactonase YvrE
MPELHDVYLLSSQTSLPEGIAFDGRTRRFFATGLLSGQITQIDAGTGEERVFFTSDEPRQFSGAKVDESNRRLWVCASDIRGPTGGLHLFDVDTGALIRHFELSTSGICNDVCLDADGVAYVTDSFQPVIYRVDARDGSAGMFTRDAQMAAPMGQFGLNGIVVTPDGEAIIGGFTSPSKLFLIPRNAPERVRQIELSGEPFGHPDPHFTGADGIIFIDDTLYVVHDGGVQQVTFVDKDYSRGVVKSALAPESGLTTATVVDGELYVIKAEVVRAMHMHLPPNLPFKIYRFPLDLFTNRPA